MKKRFLKRKNEMSMPMKNFVSLSISSVIGNILTIFLTFIISYIISKSENIPSYLGILFLFCIACGNILSGFIASKRCNFKGIISGLICSIPNALIITLIILFFSNSKINEKTLLLYLFIIFCSSVGGIIGANTKRRK